MGYRKRTGVEAILYALDRLEMAASNARHEHYYGCAETHAKVARDAREVLSRWLADGDYFARDALTASKGGGR